MTVDSTVVVGVDFGTLSARAVRPGPAGQRSLGRRACGPTGLWGAASGNNRFRRARPPVDAWAVTIRHTAIVTGANHGIGAATARALARQGCAVLCAYLRVEDEDDPGIPQAYRDYRAGDAAAVVAGISAAGGTAAAVAGRPVRPGRAGQAARRRRGATRPGRHPGQQRDRLDGRHVHGGDGRPARPGTPAGHRGHLDQAVHRRRDGRGPDDQRVCPPPHRPRRDLGPDRRPDLGRRARLPRGGVLRRGQGRPGELHDVRRAGAGAVRRHRQHGATRRSPTPAG